MPFEDSFRSIADRISSLISTCRPVTEAERLDLEKNGNTVSGTVLIRGSGNLNFLQFVKNNVFLNTVVLCGDVGTVSVSTDADLPTLTSGIFNSTLSNVVIDGLVLVKDCSMIHSCYVGPESSLVGNGVIAGSMQNDVYGIGSELILCEETGSRAIVTSPDATLESATHAISSQQARREWISSVKSLKSSLTTYRPEVAKFMGSVFRAHCIVSQNSNLKSVFLAGGGGKSSILHSDVTSSVVDGGSRIENSIVAHSVVNSRTSVSNYAVIENSILCEFAKISVNAKVVHSVIGSYSGVESGECISSLIGPFVGFHHQSLCIATYWPGGRGNIGYGANVGSNHSGKAPDCELLSGEGVFYGLATVIKFPCNFSNAVYSLIASGVTCLPQKMDFPFSLINSGAIPTHSGLNEISPAWVLSDNMFTLIRNEDKFRKRQSPDASRKYNHQVFRRDTMAMVVEARRRLTSVTSKGRDGVYTDADIAGLGKNYLRESTRLRAIDTYSFILRWYALRGVYNRVSSHGVPAVLAELRSKRSVSQDGGAPNPTCLVTADDSQSDWEFCQRILVQERMNVLEMKSLLEEFSKLDFLISTNCVASKAKDDVRGAKIVGDTYSHFHPPARDHPVCVGAKKNSAEIESSVAKLVSKL